MSRNQMTAKDKNKVLDKLQWEGGYEYLYLGSDFPEYTDPEFRRLVGNFRKAMKEIQEFLGEIE